MKIRLQKKTDDSAAIILTGENAREKQMLLTLFNEGFGDHLRHGRVSVPVLSGRLHLQLKQYFAETEVNLGSAITALQHLISTNLSKTVEQLSRHL